MKEESKSNGMMKGCLIAVAVIFGLGVLGFGGCAFLIGSSVNKVAKQEKAELERIKVEPVSDIQWEEVDKIYNLKNKFTDLQKGEHWKHYKGKKVKWSGSVSSISETFGALSIQVKFNQQTFTSDVLVRLKESERSKALKLKKGDEITFTGVLDDWGSIMPVTLDHGEIN